MLSAVRSESVYDIPFPPERVWPILSKTDWINRSLGLPPVEYVISPESTGGTAVKAKARMFGMQLHWREWPFEWLENEFYSVRRTFESGPIAEVNLAFRFNAREPRGTSLAISFDFLPRNILGQILARYIIGPGSARKMRGLAAHLQTFLEGERLVALPNLSRVSVSESALQAGLGKLRESGQSDESIGLLESMLRHSPDVELAGLRPLSVARKWKKGEWEVLRLFLQATRAGLLDLRWEVLCPNCRSSRQPLTTSLAHITRGVHCEACQIHFDAEFDKSVELKFAVNAGVRPVRSETFCLAGPGGKPHIFSQIYLAPGESRPWKLPPINFSARLRSPEVARPLALTGDELARLATVRLLCDRERFRLEPLRPGEASRLGGWCEVLNPNSHPLLLVLERLEWDGEILTAARITNWQEFRDLFAKEVILPREQIAVGQQIVLFTDLRGSTAIYNEIGDAPAYALVRDHFKVLFAAVKDHHGAVVKTIGDAVMGVFSRVDEALSAVAQMHRILHTAQPEGLGHQRLFLKSSLHLGPCLAVNANDRLDYFGTTVNLAARMVSCCRGGDVSVSRDLYSHPDTKAFLERLGLKAEAAEVNFRGFDTPQQIWRILLV